MGEVGDVAGVVAVVQREGVAARHALGQGNIHVGLFRDGRSI
jgi:hypothetical protein